MMYCIANIIVRIQQKAAMFIYIIFLCKFLQYLNNQLFHLYQNQVYLNITINHVDLKIYWLIILNGSIQKKFHKQIIYLKMHEYLIILKNIKLFLFQIIWYKYLI
ncbi:hypothetical protein PPERSA_06899 [Pseudocohnilembus persalinus]|uniref:Transmembrane protein n=1 Tax=Pseudocohnilembus persalinus TaxID=266149 RepID=A0A0V0QYI9_PSEPJ|nr:hypothetical protein PPERSA_06899 [Pseudocohnilembus persalinus]|eukprot:KRX07284.1 hypothetical protein PPERSA_06899 [Pseudocohnilembus persalinus]